MSFPRFADDFTDEHMLRTRGPCAVDAYGEIVPWCLGRLRAPFATRTDQKGRHRPHRHATVSRAHGRQVVPVLTRECALSIYFVFLPSLVATDHLRWGSLGPSPTMTTKPSSYNFAMRPCVARRVKPMWAAISAVERPPDERR